METDGAFAPMFDEPVVITCQRDGGKMSQTVMCCVLSTVTDEPYSDDMLEANRVATDFICKRSDWKFLDMVRRGDVVERQGVLKKTRYTVQSVVEDDAVGIIVKAKSC